MNNTCNLCLIWTWSCSSVHFTRVCDSSGGRGTRAASRRTFEAIVANPPFSAQWWSANPIHLSDDRFSQYGAFAESNRSRLTIYSSIWSVNIENGTIAAIMPHDFVFADEQNDISVNISLKKKLSMQSLVCLQIFSWSKYSTKYSGVSKMSHTSRQCLVYRCE